MNRQTYPSDCGIANIASLLLTIGVSLIIGADKVPALRQTSTLAGASVVGRVIDSASHSGIPDARVTLIDATQRHLVQSLTTDENGSFELTSVRPGRYEIRAIKDGFIDALFGDRPGDFEVPLYVDASTEKQMVLITLLKTGEISGFVKTSSGEPAPRVRIFAAQRTSPGTAEVKFHLVKNAAAMTDARGDFRLTGLPPGEYVLLAIPQNVGVVKNDTADGVTEQLVYAPMFFPDSLELSTATPLTLPPSGRLQGIAFQLRLTNGYHLAGLITNHLGTPLPNTRLRVTPVGLSGLATRATKSSLDGAFRVDGLSEGEYLITVDAEESAQTDAAPGSHTGSLHGSSVLTVSGHIDNFRIELEPTARLHGRVVVGDVGQPISVDSLRPLLKLIPSDRHPSTGDVIAHITSGGRFEFNDLPAGVYRLAAMLQGKAGENRWEVVSLRLNDSEVIDTWFGIKHGETAMLTVVIGRAATTNIEGIVLADGSLHPDCVVVIAATDATYWAQGSRRVRTVRLSPDGRFTVLGLPPGEYFVTASHISALGESQLGTLNDLSAVGKRVTLRPAEAVTQKLTDSGCR